MEIFYGVKAIGGTPAGYETTFFHSLAEVSPISMTQSFLLTRTHPRKTLINIKDSAAATNQPIANANFCSPAVY